MTCKVVTETGIFEYEDVYFSIEDGILIIRRLPQTQSVCFGIVIGEAIAAYKNWSKVENV